MKSAYTIESHADLDAALAEVSDYHSARTARSLYRAVQDRAVTVGEAAEMSMEDADALATALESARVQFDDFLREIARAKMAH